jgi:hypothetical protein
MIWTRTCDRLPPDGEIVLTYSGEGPYWGHAHYDSVEHLWLMGCECISTDEPPEFWARVELPRASGP